MKAFIYYTLIFMFCFSSTIFAQNWFKTFGGSSLDWGRSVQQTTDGGYILTGYTYSYGAGSEDVYLIKTDAAGNKQWDKTFGGTSSDRGYSVQQTTDGGYIITGSTQVGQDDVWLIKTDANGNMQWDKTFGGNLTDGGYCVQQTSDGGYIITGWNRSYNAGNGNTDIWLIKTDANGNKLWDKPFGLYQDDFGHSVQQTSDGGYIITGDLRSYWPYNYDVVLIKTDANGNKLWDKIFGEYHSQDHGRSVQQTSDGGYIITGSTCSYNDGYDDVWLIKTDADGNKLWDKAFGGSGEEDYGESVQQTSDGGYIIAGYTESYGAGDFDAWLIKTNAEGNLLWSETFGGLYNDYGYSVQQTSDGSYIITGYTCSCGDLSGDVGLIYYNPEFDIPLSPAEVITYTTFIMLLSGSILFFKKTT